MPSPSVALLRTQSDLRLVALAAAGHERAFEAIVERYRRQLLRHARRYLPEARAEDAVQQALVSAWTGLRRGDEVRELRPWLHRIVHNAALNALRTPGYDYDELRATLQGSGGPAELAERRAVVHGTLAGLAALPERQRQALLQIAVEGRSQDEVAEQLGLSQGAVRQLVHRARSALRAAATAVVPLPLATWLATTGAGRTDVAVRVGELVAGAGGSATLAKAGAVAVLAGGAVAGPAVVHDVRDREQRPVAESAASARAGTDRARATTPTPTPAAPAPVALEEQRDGPGGGRPAPAGDGDDDRSGRRGGEAEDAGRRRADRDDGDRGERDDGEGRSGGRRDEDHESGGRGGDDDRPESDDDMPVTRSGDGSGPGGGDEPDGGDDDEGGGSGPSSSSGSRRSGPSGGDQLDSSGGGGDGGDGGAPQPAPQPDEGGDEHDSGSSGSGSFDD
jgi:RNA polymerase sigma factor (sigma-70 family)